LNQYQLNSFGEIICSRYLDTDNGKATVVKIDTFTAFARPFVDSLNERSRMIYTSILVSYILGIYYSTIHEIIVIGPFILPKPNFVNSNNIIQFNISVLVVLIILYNLSNYLLLFQSFKNTYHITITYLFSIVPNFVLIVMLHFFSSYSAISIPLSIWLIISILSQLYFLFLNESFLVGEYGISIEKGIILIILHLYIIFGFIILTL
ncbi:MAG: hypothetical protein ACXAC2_14395, partial [Candidatus Kariarchaeaceae archaeon]